ncbi:alcohol dehydrogenase [Thermobispora bispora]|jgi:alcohol dehydrogenase|uniref:Alcohol dehydrogenase GroES domain protein n=1 Tax=Thermobispora bispora (strain ATCC 19993 / DSM 43833 / CBS 139.67 / JCM 10125 / KCTC 9307 / NBRC 14880 / R51) TaxID=469371 RepID=D6Y8W7_THEBD|nr:alcohol dehydrogenase catalytic domain-containing protein [Thermobispora bispora]MBO2474869.1 alcohol dehydrogenase [Actinomycetales bacterium]MDI9582304.1 alcohol dehydrogenase catalytic domain-containing protein [Thermobispora sp.]ADG89929.1 Alcohol dehydrogenase GroES domain protein [Thermobispora bispora DSM 43833]MBX6166617.1 alcohol dehydrogenase catalytic domain-containing protein [Thermobispora bispora]QSI49502.1 alcohol dehydrogenase [Thermobispora bispora]
MKALVYEGPGKQAWTSVPDPGIADPRDVIIQVTTAAICGTDLHILAGDVPEVDPGRVLGHEAVGIVVETGSDIDDLVPGDRVLVSCISGCGRCAYCRKARYGQCRRGGWLLGHMIDGVQAEFARVPFADLSVHRLPSHLSDELAVLLADVLPTAYEVGVLNGNVRPADTVVVVGCGPIGLAVILTARLLSPARIIAIDQAEPRLEAAKRAGAEITIKPDEDPLEVVRAVTDGLGADVVIEAVGAPETFELCTRLVRPCGRLSVIGVHGKPAPLHLEDLWSRDVTITTGLVDTYSTPTLLQLVDEGRLDVGGLITHRFTFAGIGDAYRSFADPVSSGALKVMLTRGGGAAPGGELDR